MQKPLAAFSTQLLAAAHLGRRNICRRGKAASHHKSLPEVSGRKRGREGKKKRKGTSPKNFLFGLCCGDELRNCDGVVEEFWRRYEGILEELWGSFGRDVKEMWRRCTGVLEEMWSTGIEEELWRRSQRGVKKFQKH